MINDVYINELKKFDPDSKAIIATISNVEILSYISNESNSKPIFFFISKKKIFIFKIENRQPITEVYSFDKILDLSIENKTRRRGTLVLILDNEKKYYIEDIKKEKINDFIEKYKELLNNFTKNEENHLSKNINLIDDYDDNYLLKNIRSLEKDSQSLNLNSLKNQRNDSQRVIQNVKSKRIVDDSMISDDTTFSSKYIYSLFAKKNTLLPDGKLSNIDKINSKIDEFNISGNNISSNVDDKFKKDIKNALLKINEKVNLLKENLEETMIEKVNFTDSKIDKVAENSIDSKEVMKIKYGLENTKKQIEDELKKFVKETNLKMTRISENLVSDEVLKKIDQRIEKSKNELSNEVEKIKNTFREKMYFLNEVADRQIIISKQLKNFSNNNDNFNDEIYHVQKAWLENNKKFSLYDEQLSKVKEVLRNQTDSINSIIQKLKDRMGINSSELQDESSYNNEWFLDSIHSKKNKLLAVNEKGKGIYFDIEEFKLDIDKLIVQSKNELDISVDEKIYDLKKFVINSIQEIKDKENEKVIDEIISPKKEFKKFIFRSKSYIFNGRERNGIRSGQTLGLRMEKNSPGIDSMYFCEETKEPLNVEKYDGIIFANQKYYLNNPKEFSLDKKSYFKINHIEYQEGIRPYRMFEIIINDNLIEYKAFDEKGFLISDNDPVSIKYDLKTLTFFRE